MHLNMHIPSAESRQSLDIHGIEESLRYCRHLLRMSDNSWPKLVLGQHVAEKHPRGKTMQAVDGMYLQRFEDTDSQCSSEQIRMAGRNIIIQTVRGANSNLLEVEDRVETLAHYRHFSLLGWIQLPLFN